MLLSYAEASDRVCFSFIIALKPLNFPPLLGREATVFRFLPEILGYRGRRREVNGFPDTNVPASLHVRLAWL